ncbi:hypothetical protein KJ813_08660 [bacterium]|nr:hypothetical protein [bacterium]MBU4602306.1 hypothetical protein [bacterium]
MLVQAEDLTSGTFMGFFFTEVASIVMGMVMLRSKIFSKLTAFAGILGFGFLLVFNILAAFVPTIFDVAMIFAMSGGLLSMAWFILIARRLFQLGRLEKKKLPQ